MKTKSKKLQVASRLKESVPENKIVIPESWLKDNNEILRDELVKDSLAVIMRGNPTENK
jgi:hypothetical protein